MTTQNVIDIDGFPLSYRTEEAGVVALVVGSPCITRERSSATFAIIYSYIDIRTFVPSPARELKRSDYELATLLNDIEAMRKVLKLERPIVIGHSGLAFLALEYAKHYPDAVSQVVMVGNSPDFSAATAQA